MALDADRTTLRWRSPGGWAPPTRAAGAPSSQVRYERPPWGDGLLPVIAVALTVVITLVLTVGRTEPSIALPEGTAVRAVTDAASGSVVKVVARRCRLRGTGSGFVVGPGLVVTSAHVLDYFTRFFIEDGRGAHPASVVVVDPSRDLAVLRAHGLAAKPLRLSKHPAGEGHQGVVLGFPRGGPLRAASAAVRDSSPPFAVRAPRDPGFAGFVLALHAEVENGSSGGPFVGLNGEVLGVVFSRATAFADFAYAIKASHVLPLVHEAARRPHGEPDRPAAAC